eukprot:tig00000093_g3559.t1
MGVLLALASTAAGQSTTAPCSEIQTQATSAFPFMRLDTTEAYSRSFYPSAGQSMTAELWAKTSTDFFSFEPTGPGTGRIHLVNTHNTAPLNNGRWSSDLYIFISVYEDGQWYARVTLDGVTATEVDITAAMTAGSTAHWTHYAVVLQNVADATGNAVDTRISVYVNGTLAGEQPMTGMVPRSPSSVPPLTWLWPLEFGSRTTLRDIRVWGQALSEVEIRYRRYSRIRGAADEYNPSNANGGFPTLKINVPLDFGAPGSEFNASTAVVNDVDCTPLAITSSNSLFKDIFPGIVGVWQLSDPAFCSSFSGGEPVSNACACPSCVPRSTEQSAPVSCGEIQPKTNVAMVVQLETTQANSRTIFPSFVLLPYEKRSMTVDFWFNGKNVLAFPAGFLMLIASNSSRLTPNTIPSPYDPASELSIEGYLAAADPNVATGTLGLLISMNGAGPVSIRTSLNAMSGDLDHWAHFAFVFRSRASDLDGNGYIDAGESDTEISVYVNGTGVGDVTATGIAPRSPSSVPALTWEWPILPGNAIRDIRVWGRDLNSAEINSVRYRRIRGAADDYNPSYNNVRFPVDVLKINIPLDFGAPGSEFNASTAVVNDVDCTPVTIRALDMSNEFEPVFVTSGPFGLWQQSDATFCSLFWGGVPVENPVGSCSQGGASGGGATGGTAGSATGTAAKCFPPPADTLLTRKYQLACPPNVTISRVGPVNVTAGGVVKRLCGARMPDLRFLIAGNWSDPRVNITQQPESGSFLPVSMGADGTVTNPDWIAAGFGGPIPADGFQVTVSVDNPTDTGPEGACSFRLFVREAGPPLCPGACPPRELVLPVNATTCSLALPELARGLAPAYPNCIPPRAVDAGAYEVVGADGAPLPPTWEIGGPPPHVVEARVRHRDFPSGPSCPVRIAAYLPQEPAVAWSTSTQPDAGALNASGIAALGPSPPPSAWGRHFEATVSGPCASRAALLQHCKPRVRVEVNPKLGLAGPDVDAAGNFTFGARKGAWALAVGGPAPNSVSAFFSREVPDHYLANDAIAPGEALRTYFISLSCAFNKGVPGRFLMTSLAPARVEIAKPAPQPPMPTER